MIRPFREAVIEQCVLQCYIYIHRLAEVEQRQASSTPES